MNRREFLRGLIAGSIGVAVDPEELFWKPARNVVYMPTAKQVEFFAQPIHPVSLYGIPYHQVSESTGTWLGITRSLEPLPWRKMMDHLTIDPTKPLVIIDE